MTMPVPIPLTRCWLRDTSRRFSKSRASVTVRSLWMLTTDALTRSTTSTAADRRGLPGTLALGSSARAGGPRRVTARRNGAAARTAPRGRAGDGDGMVTPEPGGGPGPAVLRQPVRVPQAHGSAWVAADLHPARLARVAYPPGDGLPRGSLAWGRWFGRRGIGRGRGLTDGRGRRGGKAGTGSEIQ